MKKSEDNANSVEILKILYGLKIVMAGRIGIENN